jgi:hypothetical protein
VRPFHPAAPAHFALSRALAPADDSIVEAARGPHAGDPMHVRPWLLPLTILVFSATLAGASTHHHSAATTCPPQGTAKSSTAKALNLLKNRATAPTPAQIVHTITLAAMVAPGNDVSRFSSGQGASIEGYVDTVYVGGIESANCEAKDAPDRDTHIELVLDPQHARPEQRVIVEVTPRWRKMVATQGKDWSTAALAAALIHHRVQVTGWMMFDIDHANASLNTKTAGAHVWRATAWEVHPITDLQILGPQGKGPAI